MARTITIIGLILNLSLAVVKIVISILSDSLSLLADGLDSALDIAGIMLGFVAIQIASKPADKDHHYGHTKFENLFSLGVSMLLVASSGIIGYQAIVKLIERPLQEFSSASVIIAATSIVLKTVLVVLYNRVGRKIESPSLIALSKNFRTDVFTSIVVLLSVSISHLKIGTFPLFWIDPTIAIGISIVIIITAIGIIKESTKVLLDESPDEETIAKIKEIALQQEGVLGVGNIRARKLASNIILVDLDVYLDESLSIHDGHEIVCDVEDILRENLPIGFIQIHMEPMHEHSKESN
jgi:cation diffusion facilitator family transporter